MAKRHYQIQDSPIERFLFNDTRTAWFWLLVRLYAGWAWLDAGWGKIGSDVWVGANAGKALGGFVQGALTKTGGLHPDVQSWYAWFLSHAVAPYAEVWSYVVAWGEVAVGLGLILGIFTGIAAFFGGFMNINYLFAGTVSTNPILGICALGLVLAWKVAGTIGGDRWILPMLGTPWRPGTVLKNI